MFCIALTLINGTAFYLNLYKSNTSIATQYTPWPDNKTDHRIPDSRYFSRLRSEVQVKTNKLIELEGKRTW